jgi:hypothetical protein
LELAALRAIRRWRAWIWGWLALGFPLMVVVALLAPGALNRVVPGWVLVWMISMLRHALCRCPACKKAFNYTGFRSNPWTLQCMNCGLALNPRGAPPPSI